jgi:hypothetical protein
MAEAMKRFSEVLDLDFMDPVRGHVADLQEGDRVQPWDVYLTYSKQGPPHIELIEAAGEGAYGLHHGAGLHHIGAWCPDVKERIAELGNLQVGAETIFRNGDDIFGAFFQPAALFGTRYEISPASVEESWRNWLNGGPSYMD